MRSGTSETRVTFNHCKVTESFAIAVIFVFAVTLVSLDSAVTSVSNHEGCGKRGSLR